MSIGVSRASFVVCATALLFASAASGASILTPFNVIVSGNFSDACCDIRGGLAVGGNASLEPSMSIANYMLGESVTTFPGSATLIVAGTLTNGPAQLYNGNYYVHSGAVTNVGTGSSLSGLPTGFTFSSQFTTFDTDSSTILADIPTSTDAVSVNGSGQLQININNAGLNVIDLTSAQAATGDIDFVLGSGLSFATSTTASGNTWVVINIAGTSPTLNVNSGVEVNGTAVTYGDTAYQSADILYNFYQATGTVTLDGSIVGSVLAPYAAVSDTSGQQFDGSLIAASFTGDAEFHNLTFLGPTIYNPEPAPIACVGLGLIALACVRRRRRRA
jgi:choice-of-anchor A domain-containing protein